jgi:hypothetical protein
MFNNKYLAFSSKAAKIFYFITRNIAPLTAYFVVTKAFVNIMRLKVKKAGFYTYLFSILGSGYSCFFCAYIAYRHEVFT